MSRLFDLAHELGALYSTRTTLAIHIAHLEQDLAARELALTPVDGWPGKNDEARKAARLTAVAADGAAQEMRTLLRDETDQLASTEATIAAREAERRGLEWDIREVLARALAGRENGHEQPEDTAFDAGSDAAVDDLPF